MTTLSSPTIDPAQQAHFDALGGTWWDESGPLKALHWVNPVRVGYIAEKAGPLKGVPALDIGCGGGILAEALAKAGAQVTGIDMSEAAVEAAAAHAEAAGLDVTYLCGTVESLGDARFPLVTALEVVEHVADVASFLDGVVDRVAPGGTLVLSTLNRTLRSLALGIGAAEYLLGWVPRGTHQWRRFRKPSELAAALRRRGMMVTDVTGIAYDPLTDSFHLSATDVAVNYLMTARKP